MAFETEWVDDPYIMGTTYKDRVSGHDLQVTMLEYLGAVQEQELYILLDFTQADGVPQSLLELPALSQVVGHGNTRWVAIANPNHGNSHTTRMLVNTKVKTFRNRESALSFLRGMVRLDKGEARES